jgi:lysophospholipase L1-like esterase
MRSRLLRLPVLFVVLGVLALFAFVSDRLVPTLPAPPEHAPRAVVGMGDSTMSGEGAGAYEPGTRGENGDWCHRSANALVHKVSIPAVSTAINLACSGATAEQVALGNVVNNTEGSQSSRLAEIVTRYRVTAIVLAVGANDDPQFSDVVQRCVQDFLRRNGPGCAAEIGRQWKDRVSAMAPKVERALRDIRTVMRKAGYPDASYALVLQSYAAPVSTDVATGLQDLSGCPFLPADLRWVSGTAVRELASGLRTAAMRAGARFLDLSRAGTGHEACSGGSVVSSEWFSRLSVDWQSLQDDQRAAHALQESFHPNALGQAAFGRCLGEFLNGHQRTATCLSGRDGALHAVADTSLQAGGSH